jgi:hypothetical protein
MHQDFFAMQADKGGGRPYCELQREPERNQTHSAGGAHMTVRAGLRQLAKRVYLIGFPNGG